MVLEPKKTVEHQVDMIRYLCLSQFENFKNNSIFRMTLNKPLTPDHISSDINSQAYLGEDQLMEARLNLRNIILANQHELGLAQIPDLVIKMDHILDQALHQYKESMDMAMTYVITSLQKILPHKLTPNQLAFMGTNFFPEEPLVPNDNRSQFM